MSRVRGHVKKGKGGKKTLAYLIDLLKDPCVYCGEPGCNSIDHVVPRSLGGPNNLDNYAPCHRDCNRRRGVKGVLYGFVGKLQLDL